MSRPAQTGGLPPRSDIERLGLSFAGIPKSAGPSLTANACGGMHPTVALLASSYQNSPNTAVHGDGEDNMIEAFIEQIVPILGILMIIAIVIGPLWIRSYFAARER